MATQYLDKAYDKLGREFKVNSIVVCPETRSMLSVKRVISISGKMARVVSINHKINPDRKFSSAGSLKYHNELLCIDELEETMLYLLTHKK